MNYELPWLLTCCVGSHPFIRAMGFKYAPFPSASETVAREHQWWRARAPVGGGAGSRQVLTVWDGPRHRHPQQKGEAKMNLSYFCQPWIGRCRRKIHVLFLCAYKVLDEIQKG